jgi:hypothetical protein
VQRRRNSNVSKILPVTTLRTIDLAGRKISDRLFSIFCAELRVFFEVFYAPEYVQQLNMVAAWARGSVQKGGEAIAKPSPAYGVVTLDCTVERSR